MVLHFCVAVVVKFGFERLSYLSEIGLFDASETYLLISRRPSQYTGSNMWCTTTSLALQTLCVRLKRTSADLFWKSCLRGSALSWRITELSIDDKSTMAHASRCCLPYSDWSVQDGNCHYSQAVLCDSLVYYQIRNGLHISERLASCFRLAATVAFTAYPSQKPG